MDMFLQVIQNIGLLMSLTIIHGLLMRQLKANVPFKALISGFLFGLVTLAGMLNPVHFAPGIIFDGRSIVLGLAGFIGGPITGITAAVIAALYRYHLGGVGAVTGILVITEATIFGIIMYYLRKRTKKADSLINLYLFGLIIHLTQLLLMFTLPGGLTEEVLDKIGFPIILSYPVATMILCYLFIELENKFKAEIALKASEERYKSYIQNAPHGIFLADSKGNYKNANKAACDLTGYSEQELKRMSILDLLPDYEREKGIQHFNAISSTSSEAIELAYKKKSGEVGWWSVQAIKLDEDNYLGFVVDLTERKMLDLALQESEKAYRKQFEESSVVMLLFEADTGKIVDGNNAAVEFYGYSREQLRSMTIFQINALPFEKVNAAISEVKHQKSSRFQFQHRLSSGELRDVEVSSSCIQLGTKSILHSIIIDITERKKAEAALQISEERLILALDAAQDGVWDWDLVSDKSYFNDKYYTMLGYEPNEFPGSSDKWMELIHPDDYTHTVKANVDCLNNISSDFNIEYRIRMKSGDYKWILGKGKAVSRDSTGKATRMIGTHTDIHERKLAQESLRESEERYRALFNNASESIFIVQDERIIFANPTTAQSSGVSLEKLIGSHITDFAPEEDKALILENHYRVLNRVVLRQDRDIRYLKANGEIGWSRTSAIFIEWNGRPAVLKFGSDITDIKRAEAALIESEEKYRFLFENAGESILVVQDFKIVIANQIASVYTGMPLEKLIGMSILSFSAPGEEENNKERLEQVLSGKNKKDIREIKIQDSKGEIRWIQASAVSVQWQGKPALLMFDVDITEIKSARAALDESEAKYRILMENIRDIVWQMSPDLVFTYVNSYAEQLLEYTPNEILGKNVFDFLTEESKLFLYNRVESRKKEASTTSARIESSIYSLDLVKKHGDIVTLEIKTNAMYDSAGVLQGLYGVARDITDRRQAEAALQKKSKELETYFNSAIDLLCLANTEGYFLKLNPEWENTLGYKLDELVGTRFLDFVHPDDIQATIDAISNLSADQDIMRFTNRYRHKDGSYRWIEWRSRPANDLIYAVARDITDRRKAEEDRLEMERRMLHVQKLESLGVLAGGMAHDFNNILMAVLGHAELALIELPALSPARDSLIEIENAARRASELSRQMLAYSGRGKFVIEPINLENLVSEMIHLLKASISKKAILNLSLDKLTENIEGDATQIRQVLMNLITNASDALEDNTGVITVSTGSTYCTKEYLASSFLNDNLDEGNYSYFEVSDTGCGMSKETIDRIFEPFFSTKFTGRGLGMAAVLGIVRGHKGAINIYSEPGKGSTFKLLFPAVSDLVNKTKANKNHIVPIQQTSGVVLLVDDEDYIRDIGSRMLDKLGFEVVTAIDGIDACKKYTENQEKISIVLLDLTMPRRDGEETYRELRCINPNVRVVLTSGFTEQEITARFAGKGLAGFIQKPFSIAELRARLQEILEQ